MMVGRKRTWIIDWIADEAGFVTTCRSGSNAKYLFDRLVRKACAIEKGDLLTTTAQRA